jgi:hypothetical protein
MKDFVLEFRTNNLNRVADMMAAELDKKRMTIQQQEAEPIIY